MSKFNVSTILESVTDKAFVGLTACNFSKTHGTIDLRPPLRGGPQIDCAMSLRE